MTQNSHFRYTPRFDPVDIEQMRLIAGLTPAGRIQLMLEAQALAKGLIMGRLRRLHPAASDHEIGLMFLEEIERANRTQPGP